MVLDDKVNTNKTEVVIRTRGRNNKVETKKGFVEVSLEQYQVNN